MKPVNSSASKAVATTAATTAPLVGRTGRKEVPRQEKPFPDFPLCWHKRGYWCKKIDGRVVNYTADWKESYDRYLADKRDRDAGQVMQSVQDKQRHTLEEAIGVMMARQKQRLDQGGIGEVQFTKYRVEMEHVACTLGRGFKLRKLAGEEGPDLFNKIKAAAMARGLSVARRHMDYVRLMLDRAYKQGLMPPPNYGDSFDPPTPEQVAAWKFAQEAEHGERAFTNDELRAIVEGAYRWSPHLFAQVLLALNDGFGADDCAILTDAMIDWDRSLIKTHRSKTMRKRIAPLWPITIEAIRASRAQRPKPAQKDWKDRVFLTADGNPVAAKTVQVDDDDVPLRTGRNDSIRQAFDDLLVALDDDQHCRGRLWTLRLAIANGYFDQPHTAREVMRDIKVGAIRATSMRLNELVTGGMLSREGKTYFATTDQVSKQKRSVERRKTAPKLKFLRHKVGFYTLRAMFRTAAVGCGADKDLIAVIKGQRFERAVDDYYLRGDLRAKLFQVVEHVFDSIFGGWSCAWPRA
jgi:integrase